MAHKYNYDIDLSIDNPHTRVIRLVGKGKRILELGCATGYMSKVLVEQFGCTVTGIERDPEAAEAARQLCSRVIVGDLDTLDYPRELAGERFDVIICADVLEHLRDPVRTLEAIRGFLSPNGYLVASIPNIAHVSVIAELLQGRFPYHPLGLLDDTHLRFFTRDSIYDCFERAGLVITHLERVRLEPEATEFRTDLSRFPAELVHLIRAHEESTTYQFVLTAHPAPAEGSIEALRGALSHAGVARQGGAADPGGGAIRWPAQPEGIADEAGYWRDRVSALIEALLARMKFLESERDRQIVDLEALRAQVARLQTDVRDHEAHIRYLQDEVGRRETQLQELQQELGRLQEEAGRIKSSVGWKLLERFRRVRQKVLPRGSPSAC